MENENFVPEIDVSVSLPGAVATQEKTAAAHAVLKAAVGRHSLSDEMAGQLEAVLDTLGTADIADTTVDLLVAGLKRDEDVSNAETTGYLRGRNENIDLMLNAPRDEPATADTAFPRYVKRSVWD